MSNGIEQPVKMYRSTTRIIPYQPDNNNYKINQCIPIKQNNQTVNGNSLLVATVNGRAVGGGNGTLYSAINSGPSIERNNRGVPSALNGESKISAGDPQVRKLVYNMYRGLLNTKHDRATDIVDAAPQQNIQTDEGVNDRVLSMMRQRSEQKEGKMNYGPPPPPPPPPFQTGAPPVRLPSEIAAAAAASSNRPQAHAPPMMMAPPAALAGAMMKDKKPFTYTPGGLNLAEIKSPRMQRRLQRNASLEGVRPSPLAAQQPPSPSTSGSHTGSSSPIIPPHGMIQVLPMPGMGMTPMTKPQPQKEPPKQPKRNVCGPAPPPPPFCISGDSSIDPSPSSTPYTTPPSATPCINSSSTPPSTPGMYSTPSTASTPPAGCNVSAPISFGLQSNSSSSLPNGDLQPTMATEPGPSPSGIPPPPPPPPPNSSNNRRKLPIPSPPASFGGFQQESDTTVHSPSSQQPPPMSPQAIVVKTDLPPVKSPELNLDTPPEANTSSSSIYYDDTSSSSHKHDDFSRGTSTSFSEREKSSSDLSKASDSKASDSKGDFNEIEAPILKLKEEIEKAPATFEVPAGKVQPAKVPVEIYDQTINAATATKEARAETASATPLQPIKIQQEKLNKDLELPQTLKPINLQSNNSESFVHQNGASMREEVTLNEKINVQNKIPTPAMIKPPLQSKTVDVNKSVVNSAPVTYGNSEELPKEDQPSSTFRPQWRMASPPPPSNTNKESKGAVSSRMVRQASLPAQPFSPPISPPVPNTGGSIYIPPVPVQVQNNVDFSTTSPTNIRASNQSPTSGLAKAPLPWMCAVKKEQSPPPEFQVHAQQTQQRLQRQRSFPLQDTKQFVPANDTRGQYLPNQGNSYDNSAYSLPVAQASLVSPPQVFNNVDTVSGGSKHTWRSPSHQTNPQQQAYPPLIQTIQQLSQNIGASPQGQQPRPTQHVNQQPLPQPNRPRERIIPIMLEDSPPVTPTRGNMSGAANSFISNNSVSGKLTNHQPQQMQPQKQTSWPNTRGTFSPPTVSPPVTETGGGFINDEDFISSTSAIEALQQMQQNLAQLNTRLETSQPEQNGNPAVPLQIRGPNDPPMQSRSFKVIQNAYDHNSDPSGYDIGDSQHTYLPDEQFQSHNQEPQCYWDPVDSGYHDPQMADENSYVYKPSYAKMLEDQRVAKRTPAMPKFFKVLQAMTNTLPDDSGPVLQPENQQSQPEPRKYVGASIPSRSFRMLQAMTDTEDVPSEEASSGPGHHRKPLLSDESTAPSESLSKPHTPIQHSNSSSPSTSTAPSPSLLTPSVSTSSVSIQCMGDQPHIGSRVAPSYTCTRDSPAYRQVVPKIIKGGDKEERVINSALSSKRENSPRPWQLSDSLRSHSPVSVSRSSSIGSDKGGATTWQVETDSRPRLMNFIQAERQNSDSTSEAKEGYQLYGGNKIPSRVFQQLQNDYSENNGSSTSNGSSVKVTEVHLPRLMKHMNVDRCLSADDDTMSCTSRNSEYDDVHMNGLMETAEVKGSVLKELTSHFEPQSSLKKPRAAPGRVFRYLQQQYDDPQDTGLGSTCSSSSPLGSRSTNGSPSPLGNRSANVSPNDRSSSVSSTSAESGHFEIEPKPYGGARIPGRPGPGQSDL